MGSVFEIDLNAGIWITLFAVTSYTFIGGFLAVSRTDVFQAVLMLAGFIIMPITLLVVADDPFREVGRRVGRFFNPFTDPSGEIVTPVFLIGLRAGAWARSARSACCSASWRWKARRRSTRAATSRSQWIVGIYALSFLLGLLAHPALEAAGIETTDPEQSTSPSPPTSSRS